MSDLQPQQSSIRIRRTPSAPSIPRLPDESNASLQVPGADGGQGWNRPRSASAASRMGKRISGYLPRLAERSQSQTQSEEVKPAQRQLGSESRPVSDAFSTTAVVDGGEEYDSNLVDFLDLIDPEVQTLSTLTNVQNSLFVPDLGRFVNRRPSYNISRVLPDSDAESPVVLSDLNSLNRTETSHTLASITSRQTVRHFAVLPHGVRLDGWSEEDRRYIDDHVRHMLHSRRSKFKQSMRGFGQYIKRPLGFFITLYAVLITLFGLIWVLFLIGWLNVGGRKYYIINVIDNILVALFAIMGDGLAPFRVVDTYHMIFIAHYHHLTWRLRREKSLPKLRDRNDLPPLAPAREIEDIEAQETVNQDSSVPGPEPEKQDELRPNKDQISVLTEKQQKKLMHHQKEFSKSHTFYKPHETSTHHAFPLRLLITIVVLLDWHSLLQISLGTCTWAISYHVRPFALTTVILCCSITVNITAGILISVGDHKTRKKDVLERIHRQELTAEVMGKLEKKKRKERETVATDGTQGGEVGDEIREGESLRSELAVPKRTLQVPH